MPLRFVGYVRDQAFTPCLGAVLARLIGRHGGISGSQALADDMWTREFSEEATDPPTSDDSM